MREFCTKQGDTGELSDRLGNEGIELDWVDTRR